MNPMTTSVIKIKPELLGKLKEVLEESKGVVSKPVTNPHESFRASYMGAEIVVYTSGKIVMNKNEGAELMREALAHVLTEDADYDFVIGSDEAGKGEWLGPLCVSAVALNPIQERLLVGLGVMDSKDVPLSKISDLAQTIHHESLGHSTILVSPESFNSKIADFHKEGKNLNDLLAWAHAKAISELLDSLPKLDSEDRVRIIVDEFDSRKTEYRLSRVIGLDRFELIQKHNAEEETPVAAASIIARNAREQWIEEASLRTGFDLRTLSLEHAKKRDDIISIAKVTYLGL
jgi:ribonuclease HIII